MGQAIPETAAETRGLVVDQGWGEYWLADPDLSPTRVTAEQVETLSVESVVEAGACDVRFSDAVGDLLGLTADGRWLEIGEDGQFDDVTKVVTG